MENDYVIQFDESGQPYIAHAWGKRGANQAHKYIAKIGEGAKARYFYTQEELRAFQQGGRQKAQNVANAAKQKAANAANSAKEKVSDAAGRVRENSVLLNVGNQYRAAQRAHQNSKSSDPQTAKWGKQGYDDNNTLGGKVYKAQQKSKDAIKNSLRKNVPGYRERENAINKKNQADIAERERVISARKLSKAVDDTLKAQKEYEQKPSRDAHQKYTVAKNRLNDLSSEYYGNKDSEGKLTKADKTRNDAIDAMAKYRDTPLYKLEEFSKHPIKKATDVISDAAMDTIWSVEDKINSIKDNRQQRKNEKKELRKQMDPLVSKARQDYQDATREYNKANNRFMNYVLSSDAKKDSAEWKQLEREYDRAYRILETATEDLEKAERKYK